MTAPVLTLHKPAAIPALELRPAVELIPYARNSNTHPPGQLAKLRAAIEEYGWTNPVLVDESGGVVAGHGRLLAYDLLLKAGQTAHFPNGSPIPAGMVPVLSCAGWTEAQRRAYVIADNRIAAESVLDDAVMAMELTDLSAMGFDLALTGLDDDEVSALLAMGQPEPAAGDPDALPSDDGGPVSVPGDTWACGPHRVHCGDCREPAAWSALMQGELADVVWTDPPYLVDMDLKNRRMDAALGESGRVGKGGKAAGIANDKMTPGEFREFLGAALDGVFAVLKPGASIYLSHSDAAGRIFREALEAAGFKFHQGLVWRKNNHVMGFAKHLPIHEPIMFGYKPGSRQRWYGGRSQTTVVDWGDSGPVRRLEDGRWAVTVGDDVLIVSGEATLEQHPGSVVSVPRPARSELHPSQKPVELIERQLRNSARPGDIVVDGFAGSGSTLVAADRLGMVARVMELQPEHADTVVRRWQMLTGRRAVHAVTGQPFPGDGEVRQPVEPAAPGLDAF